MTAHKEKAPSVTLPTLGNIYTRLVRRDVETE